MARERDPKRALAFDIYREHGGEITNREIAKKLDLDEKVIAVWKGRDKWKFLLGESEIKHYNDGSPDRKIVQNVVQQNENVVQNDDNVVQQKSKVVQQKSKVVQQKDNKKKKAKKNTGTKSPKKSRKGMGNPNPVTKFKKRNQAALSHGLYAKYMNAEQIAIIEEFETMDISEHLWYQIQCSFSAIVRAQRIMWVSDNADHTREIKKDGVNGQEFEIAFSHDKYDSFVKAQSKAMADYRTLVKKFLELSHEEDERRLKLEAMTLNVEKSKLEIKKLEEGNEQEDNTLKIEFIKREGNTQESDNVAENVVQQNEDDE